PEPADQHGRNGRIARQLLGQRRGNLVQRDIAGRQRVEARHAIRRDLPGDETGGVIALYVLRDGLAEVGVDPVVAAGEIRPLMRLRQRLDGEADAQRRSINSAWCLAARLSRSFGLGGLISASAKRIWSSRARRMISASSTTRLASSPAVAIR